MGQVVKLGALHARDTVEVLYELLELALRGELHSLAVAAEISGKPKPIHFVKGRYRSLPHRGLAAVDGLYNRMHQAANFREGRRHK